MNRIRFAGLAALPVLSLAATSFGALSLSVVETQVPKSATATLTIIATATEGEIVQGLELQPKINDGGIANGGTSVKPPIVAGPSIAGTIWGAGSTADQPTPISSFPLFPQFSYQGIAPLTPNGIVAILTIDTSGLAPGETFTVDLTDGDSENPGYSSYFTPPLEETPTAIPELIDLPPFTITVVPEPASLGLLAGGVGLLMRRRRA
jgi:hypothetical protein